MLVLFVGMRDAIHVFDFSIAERYNCFTLSPSRPGRQTGRSGSTAFGRWRFVVSCSGDCSRPTSMTGSKSEHSRVSLQFLPTPRSRPRAPVEAVRRNYGQVFRSWIAGPGRRRVCRIRYALCSFSRLATGHEGMVCSWAKVVRESCGDPIRPGDARRRMGSRRKWVAPAGGVQDACPVALTTAFIFLVRAHRIR
jgi:hypothetical protein